MRGRYHNKKTNFTADQFSADILPKKQENPFTENVRHSKVIRMYIVGEDDYLIGYYDYDLNLYLAYQGTYSNPKAKTKIDPDKIKYWKYV